MDIIVTVAIVVLGVMLVVLSSRRKPGRLDESDSPEHIPCRGGCSGCCSAAGKKSKVWDLLSNYGV